MLPLTAGVISKPSWKRSRFVAAGVNTCTHPLFPFLYAVAKKDGVHKELGRTETIRAEIHVISEDINIATLIAFSDDSRGLP